jgi:hypothetical protein
MLIFHTDYPDTIEGVANRIYSDQTFDTALPQAWVDALCGRDLDPRGHFIWLYPQGLLCGRAAPITERGVEIASILATFVTMR